MVDVTFSLPRAVFDRISNEAQAAECSLDEIALNYLLGRNDNDGRNTKDRHAQKQLPGEVFANLLGEFEDARTWPELQGRLYLKGYALKPSGRQITLFSHPEGREICELGALVQDQDALVQRFGAGFPGHACQSLAAELSRPMTAPAVNDADPDPVQTSGRQHRRA